MLRNQPTRISKRGDVLLNTMVGIIVTFLFLAFGLPFFAHIIKGGGTAGSKQILMSLSSSVASYIQDAGTLPASATFFTNTTYVPSTPCDAADQGCAASEFTLTAGTGLNYVLTDAFAQDAATLASLHKYSGSADAPTSAALCGAAGCTKLVYSPTSGYLGN